MKLLLPATARWTVRCVTCGTDRVEQHETSPMLDVQAPELPAGWLAVTAPNGASSAYCSRVCLREGLGLG